MVKHSLIKMLKKYPYFLDKRRVSNLFKVTEVNNSIFQDLYNSLFNVYESFHLNKRLLIWRTQVEPYMYQTHFCCSYPNIKKVEIYKNDTLIRRDEFSEEEEKTDYCWTYDCKYIKTNMFPIKVYRCITCDEIYIGDTLPPVCDDCGRNTYITTKMYECNNCGEIYFTNNVEEVNIDPSYSFENNPQYLQINAYKCRRCGEVYEEIPNECINNCNAEYDIVSVYKCPICGYIHETLPAEYEGIERNSFTEVYAYRCMGNYDDVDDSEIVDGDIEGLDYSENEVSCGEIYIGSIPPEVCKVCGAVGYDKVSKLYYNDDTIIVNDNSVSYEDNGVIITVEDDEEIDPILYDILYTYVEEEEYNLRIDGLDETIEEDDGILRIPFPVIPDDEFKFYVETWDEYWNVKGFPENDVRENNEFDHDYSLDEIGALNNIPRKRYVDVNEVGLYPLTEPPFNKYATEDDYHYMKRMVAYNIRLWASLNLVDVKDEYYDYYMELLEKIGVSEEDYKLYYDGKQDVRLFRERYNPVSLELWKNYSIDSRLVNRERLLLKLFDLRKHNSNYVRYKLNNEGNFLYNDSFVYKDEWDIVTDLAECWVPREWEHKDKFCDSAQDYGEYLYVIPTTLRPLPFENVEFTFKLLNSLGEEVDDDYYVNLYYYRDDKLLIKRLGNRDIKLGNCGVSYKVIHTEIPTHILFKAYTLDGDFIDECEVTLNPRNCENADLYVDANSMEAKEDGSKEYPFKNLQDALNKVNSRFNVIVLKSDLTITEPLFVSNNCKILGCRGELGKVPIITNVNDNKFFKIIGGKNCSLTLIDVRLKRTPINTYVGISTWVNKNNIVNGYSTVIINGGLCLIDVISPVEISKFYPSDVIPIKIRVTNKKNVPLSNVNVKIYFDGEEVYSGLTDSNGFIELNLPINKSEPKSYPLEFKVISEDYFTTTRRIMVDCSNEPEYISSDGSAVSLISDGHTDLINEGICVYSNGVQIGTTVVNSNGVIEYSYVPEHDGQNIVVFKLCGSDVVIDMFVVETVISMDSLVGKKFIKNLEFNANTGYILYDSITVDNTTTMRDLHGIIINLRVNGEYIEYDTLQISPSRVENYEILYTEAVNMVNAVTKISFSSTTYNISVTLLGEFWR